MNGLKRRNLDGPRKWNVQNPEVDDLHIQTVKGPIDRRWTGQFRRTVYFHSDSQNRMVAWNWAARHQSKGSIMKAEKNSQMWKVKKMSCGKWCNIICLSRRDKLLEVAVFRCFELEKPKLSWNFDPKLLLSFSKILRIFFKKSFLWLFLKEHKRIDPK